MSKILEEEVTRRQLEHLYKRLLSLKEDEAAMLEEAEKLRQDIGHVID